MKLKKGSSLLDSQRILPRVYARKSVRFRCISGYIERYRRPFLMACSSVIIPPQRAVTVYFCMVVFYLECPPLCHTVSLSTYMPMMMMLLNKFDCPSPKLRKSTSSLFAGTQLNWNGIYMWLFVCSRTRNFSKRCSLFSLLIGLTH